MFVRKKKTTRGEYHYLVENVRVAGRVHQRVLCYLGKFDSLEDCYVNAIGKRRARLARFRDAADICNEQILAEQERAYKRMQRGKAPAPASAIRILLPALPALGDLPMGRTPLRGRRRRTPASRL